MTPDSDHSNRLHDLKTVQINFNTMVHLLKTGYSFEEGEMAAAIEQLEKSLKHLQREIHLLETLEPIRTSSNPNDG